MKKPTTTQEKVIINPRPPKDTAQEGPAVVTPAGATEVPDVNPTTEDVVEGPAVAEKE